MALAEEARSRIEADLCRYFSARATCVAVEEGLAVLRGPETARWSQVRAQRGRVSDPTYRRAAACAAILRRVARDREIVAAVDGWLWAPARHPDDRLLLALIYGLHRPQRVALEEAAGLLGIPCAAGEEREAVRGHVDGLLAEVGRALGYRVRA